jgi:tetratricopeptide (TPR) repeat protein
LPVLESLIQQRFLVTGDDDASLWLSPVVQSYVYKQQPKEARQRRHRLAASYYEAEGDLLAAARHWHWAGHDARAARVLLPAADDLVHELQAKELIDLLRRLDGHRLAAEQRYAVYLLLADLLQRTGQPEEALDACRHALQAAEAPVAQARVYRRMGKLYESRNPLHALRYYQQAIERFAPQDPELAELYKDRGWIFSLREEWAEAEADLQKALDHAPADARALRGDIYDAIAGLYRKTGEHGRAVDYAGMGLALREEEGDLLRVAKSHGNLGLIYRAMGEFGHAITAYQEALAAYVKLGNQELVAVALLNSGAAYFLGDRRNEALEAYRQSLEISAAIGLPLIEMKAHFNLAETFAVLERYVEAASHWQSGVHLCRQHGFDDQIEDFRNLAASIPSLEVAGRDEVGEEGDNAPAEAVAELTADEEAVLALVRRERTLTPKRLMEAASVSRATATRRLTALVEKGYLQIQGKGRAVAYRLAAAPQPSHGSPAAGSDTSGGQLQSRLAAERANLQSQFAVAALGAATPPPAAGIRLVVRFKPRPDLDTYFALRQHLSNLLGLEVDIVVEAFSAGKTKTAWYWE